MVSVTVSHVIGTVALIGLFFTASMSYSIFFGEMREQAMMAQLQSIADHVSTVILDLYSIGSSSQGNQLLVKTLSIPPDVSRSSYNVSLIRTATPSAEMGFAVLVRLTWKPILFAESQLPWNVENGRLSLSNGTLPEGVETSLLQPKPFVLSGPTTPVVWYCRSGSNATLGLGLES